MCGKLLVGFVREGGEAGKLARYYLGLFKISYIVFPNI